MIDRFTRRRGWLAVAWVAAVTTPVQAHMTVEGAGDFGNGALHPLMTPGHVLVVLGLGLWLGQRIPLDLKIPLRVFAPVSAVALALTSLGWGAGIAPVWVSVLALAIAALVGLEKPLPRIACAVVCAMGAALVALDSGVEAANGWVAAKMLVGTWLAINAMVCYIAICASNGMGKTWARIGIRVIGSWIFAITLLVVAFSLRK